MRERRKRHKTRMAPAHPDSAIPRPLSRPGAPFIPQDPPGLVFLPHPTFQPFRPPSAAPDRGGRTPRTAVPRPGSTLSSLLAEARDHGVVRPAPPATRATMSLLVAAKGSRAKLMADARPLNALPVPYPPPRRWLRRDDVESALRGRSWYFCTLDVRRCFDSIVVPSALRPLLTVHVRAAPGAQPTALSFSRLPFGWAWAPVLAQELVERIVTAALPKPRDAVVAVYLDDILVAAATATRAEAVAAAIATALSAAGFSVAEEKSQLSAAQQVEYIGFRWSSCGTSTPIAPCTPAEVRAALCGRPLTTRLAARVAGRVLWGAPYLAPFLLPLRVAQPGSPTPRAAINAAAAAASLAARALSSPTGEWRAFKAGDRLGPAVIFTDAAASVGMAAVVLVVRNRRPVVRSWRIPAWATRGVRDARDQQVGELYALSRAVRLLVARGHWDCTVVSDSASALWTALRMRPRSHTQAALLRPLAELRAKHPGLRMRFAFTPSEANPADPASRGIRSLSAAKGPLAAAYREGVRPPPGYLPGSCIAPRGLMRDRSHTQVEWREPLEVGPSRQAEAPQAPRRR